MPTIPPTAALPADRLGKTPGRIIIGVVLDDHLLDAHQAAQAALETARGDAEAQRRRSLDAARLDRAGAPDQVREAVADLLTKVEEQTAASVAAAEATAAAAEAALDAATLWFTFRGIGRRRYAELVAAHPPRDEDHETAKTVGHDRAQWNAETFPAALVQAACADPVLSDEDVAAIFDGDAWSDGDIQALFQTAVACQLQSRTRTRAGAA